MKYRERYSRFCTLREDIKNAGEFKLEFDPENAHDEFAIKALLRIDEEWHHFGYVARADCRNSEFRKLLTFSPRIEVSRPGSTSNVVKLRVFK